MAKTQLPKSTGLLWLDAIYEIFAAFVLWRKKNDDYFLAKRQIAEEERAEDEAREKAAELIKDMTDGE